MSAIRTAGRSRRSHLTRAAAADTAAARVCRAMLSWSVRRTPMSPWWAIAIRVWPVNSSGTLCMGSSMRRIRSARPGLPRASQGRKGFPHDPRGGLLVLGHRERNQCHGVGETDRGVQQLGRIHGFGQHILESSGEDSVHRFSDVGTHDRAHLPVDLRVEAVERGGRDHVEVTHAIDSTQGASHACHAVVLSTGLDRRRPDQSSSANAQTRKTSPRGSR